MTSVNGADLVVQRKQLRADDVISDFMLVYNNTDAWQRRRLRDVLNYLKQQQLLERKNE